MRISENISQLQPSATLAVATRCKQMRARGLDVLDLSAGEPDFRTPEFAAQAGIAAIEQGFTHYTPVAGVPELRAAVAAYLARTCGIATDQAGVVISTGAKQALFNACFSLFGPGDDVLIPAPYWTSYPEILTLARANAVFVPGDPERALKIDVTSLEAARTPATRGIILNSPTNPTGAVYSLDELRDIATWAQSNDLWIISDEIYGRLCYTSDRAASILDLDPSLLDRSVVIDGVSKSFAMTGWRIGFSYSAPQLAGQFAAVQSHITSGASSPAQLAALAAYRDEPRVEHAVKAMLRVFRRRREHAADALHTLLPLARFVVPDGSFYMFARVDAYFTEQRPDSLSLCNELLDRAGVALVPGSAFGDDRYVRISFAAPEGEILEGLRRAGELLHGDSISPATGQTR